MHLFVLFCHQFLNLSRYGFLVNKLRFITYQGDGDLHAFFNGCVCFKSVSILLSIVLYLLLVFSLSVSRALKSSCGTFYNDQRIYCNIVRHC